MADIRKLKNVIGYKKLLNAIMELTDDEEYGNYTEAVYSGECDDHCICGVKILDNYTVCHIPSGISFIVGSCCKRQFSTKICKSCLEPHKNRSVMHCNQCRPKCVICKKNNAASDEKEICVKCEKKFTLCPMCNQWKTIKESEDNYRNLCRFCNFHCIMPNGKYTGYHIRNVPKWFLMKLYNGDFSFYNAPQFDILKEAICFINDS